MRVLPPTDAVALAPFRLKEYRALPKSKKQHMAGKVIFLFMGQVYLKFQLFSRNLAFIDLALAPRDKHSVGRSPETRAGDTLCSPVGRLGEY
jgi:hypothetical protein